MNILLLHLQWLQIKSLFLCSYVSLWLQWVCVWILNFPVCFKFTFAIGTHFGKYLRTGFDMICIHDWKKTYSVDFSCGCHEGEL